MNKVLETVNKERAIKSYRRKLINGDNGYSQRLAKWEKLYAEIGQEKCAWCKKKLSNPNIFFRINEEKRLAFCSAPDECFSLFVEREVGRGKDNEKCSYCKKNFSDSEIKWTYSFGSDYRKKEKKEFCSLECMEKFRAEKSENNENNQIKDFSRTYLFAGSEFNNELEQLSQHELKNQINFIDFNLFYNEAPEFIERKIKEIYNIPQNQKLIEVGNFPIICFKNVEKVERNQNLEEALLPVFDKQQNSELFHGEVNLSNFIILATTSTPQIGNLSDPLISRLDVVNVDTVQTKQFFLDKYYYWFLVPSILVNLILITLILWPKFVKKTKK